MSRKKADEQFKMEFAQKGNPNVELLGKYVNQKVTIPARCKICGYEWNAWPVSLLRGAGCQRCAGNLKKTTDEFIEEMKVVNPDIKVLGEYKNTHTPIEVECKVCGNKWNAMPSNLLRNYGCPNCNGGVKLTDEQFKLRMTKIHPDIEVLTEYENMNQPIKLKCLRCGNIWETTPNTVVNGQKSGCPACAHNQTSFLEQIIYEVCRESYGEDYVLSRDRKLIGSELDIVILDNNRQPIYAIEPGSWTLHKRYYEKDKEKIIQCNQLGIKLLIIYDQDTKREVKETSNVWPYRRTFSIADDTEIIALLNRIADFLHTDLCLTNFKKIKDIAHSRSRRMSTKEFKLEMNKVNPDIEVLGEYNGAQTKTLVRCKKCGYEWETIPQLLLLYGTGCPKCHNVVRKNTAYFIDEISRINPDVTILGQYKNATEKILTKCNKCGYEWLVRPDKLRRGSGCPKCAAKKRALSICKSVRNMDTKEEYISIKSATESTGIKGISECCRGMRETAGGYHWEFI